MKFSYSLLKTLVPGIPNIKKVSDALNTYSFEVESFEGDTLDIKLPSHRYSDAGSHLGVARELSAIFNLKLKDPIKTLVNLPSGKGKVKIKIENKDLCRRYIGRYFELSKVGASSAVVKKALVASGTQSINSVVDIMNFVMLVAGSPLHAFDADKVKGPIVVRLAKKGEKITTLDDRHVELLPSTLVIADSERPLAIAGIKGGKDAAVTKDTKRIILEAANFDPVSIFKSSRELKIQTDASLRFAHDLSPALAGIAADYATLLLKAQGAKLLDSTDIYPKKASEELISFDAKKYEELIGAPLNPKDMKRYFSALGFEMTGNKVRVPAWRTDISEFEDLAEEVARLAGFENLPSSAPRIAISPTEEDPEFSSSAKAKDQLIALGLSEVYNSSFWGERENSEFPYSFFGSDASPAELLNPISEDKKFLRKNLSAHLLKDASENSRYFEKIRIFELGKVFSARGANVQEKLVLGICIAGKKDRYGILEVKGALSELAIGIGAGELTFEGSDFLEIFLDGKNIGFLRGYSEVPGAKQWTAAIGEIDATALFAEASEELEFRPLPKYPQVIRDISIIVPLDARIGDMVRELSGASKLLRDVDLLDEYTDAKLSDKQSLTFRLIYGAEERTLSDLEVNAETEKAIASLREKFNAETR